MRRGAVLPRPRSSVFGRLLRGFSLFFVLALLLATGAVGSLQVLQSSRTATVGYELRTLERQRAELGAQARLLEAEIASMANLERVHERAVNELGMVAAEDQVRIAVSVATPGRRPDARALRARNAAAPRGAGPLVGPRAWEPARPRLTPDRPQRALATRAAQRGGRSCPLGSASPAGPTTSRGGTGCWSPALRRLSAPSLRAPRPDPGRRARSLRRGGRGRFASLALLAGTSLSAGQDAVERELRVRAWALEPGRHRAAWSAAAESESWTDRIDALDALTRALRFGSRVESEWIEGLARSVVADHPNVQAALLRWLTAAAADRHEIENRLSLDRSALPELREAMILRETALGRRSADPRSLSFLVAAARDEQDDVARSVAQQLLATAGPELAPLQIEWLGMQGTGIDEQALLDALPNLVVAGVAPELVSGLRSIALETQAGARQKGLVELLEWRARGPAGDHDPALLLPAWRTPAPDAPQAGPTFESRWRRACREGLSAGDPELGRALLQLAQEEWEPDAPSRSERARDLARDAAEALADLDPWPLLIGSPEGLVTAFLESALVRPAPCEPEVVGSWCTDATDVKLRAVVMRWLATRLRSSMDSCALGLLTERLLDPDPVLRELAFRALANVPQPPLATLHAAWEKGSVEQRLDDLRWLSREHPPLPFREDLLRFVTSEESRRPSVFQLLATFKGDAEVASALTRVLRAELEGLVQSPSPEECRRHELHARSAAVALETLSGPECVPELEAALDRALSAVAGSPAAQDEDGGLPKKLVALLGRHQAGVVNLARRLSANTPRRTRVEAAIWILRGIERQEQAKPVPASLVARKVLTEDYSHCDSELGVRILGALEGMQDEATRRFLSRVAQDEGEAFERRLAAVDALAEHAAQAELRQLLAVRSTDVRVAAARALCAILPASSLHLLHSMFDARRVPFLLPDEVALEDPESLIAAEFLLGMAKREALPDDELATVLARPRVRARTQLAERFQGRLGARVDFTWSLELQVVRELARVGRGGALLQQETSLAELDGRLLAALSASVLDGAAMDVDEQRAHASLAVAERLARAAAIALAGEPRAGDRSKIELVLWVRRLSIAQARADWESYARLARGLLGCWERGEITLWALEALLGQRDLRAGVDPVARLRAAEEQAAARAAWQRGELEAAREHARRARGRLGASRAAARAQQDLEAEHRQ